MANKTAQHRQQAAQRAGEDRGRTEQALQEQAEKRDQRPESGEKAKAGGHVVLTDAFTYTVKGRLPHELDSVRAGKGSLVYLDEELNDVERMIALKAIAEDDGKPKRRTTAKALAEAAGGREDPVAVPDNLFDVTGDDATPNGDEAPDGSTPADDE